jgi:hypothetical protein
MGKTGNNNGTLCFVGPDGKMYVGRMTATNARGLRDAGYTSGGLWVPLSNGEKVANAHENEHRFVFHTPENEDERLIWAIRDGNMAAFNHALNHGADVNQWALGKGSMVQAVLATSHSKKVEMIERLYQASYSDAQVNSRLEQGSPVLLLHTAVAHYSQNAEFIQWLLDNRKVDPLARGIQNGLPAFLTGTRLEESLIIIDSALKQEGLSRAEFKLLKFHRQHIAAINADDHASISRAYKDLITCWQAAHILFKQEPDAKIPSSLHSLMEPAVYGDLERREKFFQSIRKFGPDRFNTVHDVSQEFAAHVLLPLALREWSRRGSLSLSDENLKLLDNNANLLAAQLRPLADRVLFQGRSLDKIIGLSQAWHDPRNAFPDALRPIKANGQWHSLTQESVIDVDPVPGLKIHVLTTDEELKREGSAMSHCVGGGGYSGKCLQGTGHILSVRTTEGKILSTMEVNLQNGRLNIAQNRAEANAEAPSEARIAAEWFKDGVEKGRIPLNNRFGETDLSKSQRKRPRVLQVIGYEIADEFNGVENIEAALAEYKKSQRRALEYNPQTDKFDLQSRKTDFFAGNVDVIASNGQRTGQSMNIRDLSARDWFAMTGLDDHSLEALRPLMEPLQKHLAAREKTDVLARQRAQAVVAADLDAARSAAAHEAATRPIDLGAPYRRREPEHHARPGLCAALGEKLHKLTTGEGPRSLGQRIADSTEDPRGKA